MKGLYNPAPTGNAAQSVRMAQDGVSGFSLAFP